MNWIDPPNFDQVKEVHLTVGKLKAEIKALEKEIELETLDIKKNNPRKPWLIQEATLEKQQRLILLQCELERAQATLDFLVYWKDMYRQVSYNGSRML